MDKKKDNKKKGEHKALRSETGKKTTSDKVGSSFVNLLGTTGMARRTADALHKRHQKLKEI